jgi:hypothetical protein
MTEDEIRARLSKHVLRRVADATGLHYATVRRFMKQEGGPYQQSTLNLLRGYLAE